MKSLADSLLLYGITDRSWLNGKKLEEAVEEALSGGITMLQVREKALDFDQYVAEAKSLARLCHRYGVPLVVNDELDVALAAKADGLHVGQSDLECSRAKKELPSSMILGVSASTIEQSLQAETNGADYLGVGAVFPTSTKADASHLSPDILQSICHAVTIPVVGIGGITKENIPQLEGCGIAGVAIVSAIFAQKHIKEATEELRKEVTRCLTQ